MLRLLSMERCRFERLRFPLTIGASVCLVVLLSATSLRIQAAWFKRSDQVALEAFDQGDFDAAAKHFSDDYRRGVALYRTGKYGQAADAFRKS
jgi:Ca-activated chloride channel family protein